MARTIEYKEVISGSYRTCDCGEQIHPNEICHEKIVRNDRVDVAPDYPYDYSYVICDQCWRDETGK